MWYHIALCDYVLFCFTRSNRVGIGYSFHNERLSWCLVIMQSVNTLRPRQNGRHFPDDIFKRIFLNANVWISLKISLKFVPNGHINNNLALVQIMAWRRPGDKPLSERMRVSLPTHKCVTRPQWVKRTDYQMPTYIVNKYHYSNVDPYIYVSISFSEYRTDVMKCLTYPPKSTIQFTLNYASHLLPNCRVLPTCRTTY